MSRHTVVLDEDHYVVLGWDSPLQSYFWDIYNSKDERRIYELETVNQPDDPELKALYEKYKAHGGEPIEASSELGGPRRITEVAQLQDDLKKYFPLAGRGDLQALLFMDQAVGR